MDNELFENALYQWRFGAEEDDEMSKYAWYGIDDLRNHPERGKLGTLFGNDDEMSDAEGSSTLIRALIVTPRVRGWYWDPNGTLVETSETHNYNGNVGELLYYDQVGRIADDLKEAIPHISTVVVDYPPQLLTHAEMMMRNQGNMGEAVWSVVLLNRIRDTPRGKVMLQYQPAKSCNDNAAMRWWVDALPMLGDRFPNSKRSMPDQEQTGLQHRPSKLGITFAVAFGWTRNVWSTDDSGDQ
ncbi:immunoglobulin A1 protease [Colletotrichum tofieldiae]|nr:immunoglobulin A1 protease [Colletotrichum tofieldiae]